MRRQERKTISGNLISYFITEDTFVGVDKRDDLGLKDLGVNITDLDNYNPLNDKHTYKNLIYGGGWIYKNEKVKYLLEHLENQGYFIGPMSLVGEQELIKQGYKLVAKIKGTLRDSFEEGPKGESISIFQKKSADDKIFLVNLDETKHVKTVYDNFISRNSGEGLGEGVWVDRGYATNMTERYKVLKEIEKLKSNYKCFDMKKLKELGRIHIISEKDKIQNKKLKLNLNIENAIFIPIHLSRPIAGCIDEISGPQENYFMFEFDSEKVSKEYLLIFFETEFGKLLLKGCVGGNYIIHGELSDKSLTTMEIPVPEKSIQEKMTKAYQKIGDIWDTLKTIYENLVLNPQDVDLVLSNLNEKKLRQLDESYKIMELIKEGEGMRLEFKKTFSKPVETPASQKEIQKSSLKNIAGFMNKDGGTLLIGVSDNGDIYGIENDNYSKSDDDYLKHFKDVVKTNFEPPVLNVISFKIVKVEGKKVLRVDCPKSERLIYLKDERDGAYVKTNPAVEKLTGQDLIDYSESRKKK